MPLIFMACLGLFADTDSRPSQEQTLRVYNSSELSLRAVIVNCLSFEHLQGRDGMIYSRNIVQLRHTH